MKMFTLVGSHTGSMTFPMSYDYPSVEYTYDYPPRKGWKGLSSLEKSLSVSLGVTSILSLALMIAVIVVGVDRNKDCTAVEQKPTTLYPSTIPGGNNTPPNDRCNTTTRPRPPRPGSPTTVPTPTTPDDDETTIISIWGTGGNTGSSDCMMIIDDDDDENSTICIAPQCFRMAGRIIESIDFSVDPCTDFYEFACGSWIEEYPVPEYRRTSGWGRVDVVREKNVRGVRGILETDHHQSNDSKRSLRLARDFYHSCMHPPDDEVGVAEMRLLLEEMGSLRNTQQQQQEEEEDDMMTTLGLGLSNIRRFLGVGFILELEVGDYFTDRLRSSKAVYLGQPMLGLASVLKSMKIDDYDDDNDEMMMMMMHTEDSSIQNSYRQLARRLWLLVYPGDAFKVEKVLTQIFEFEGDLMRILDADDLEISILLSGIGVSNNETGSLLSSTMISWLSEFVDRVLERGGGESSNNRSSSSSSSPPPVVLLRNVKYFERLEGLLLDWVVVSGRSEVVEKYLKLRILLSYGLHGSYAFQEIFEESFFKSRGGRGGQGQGRREISSFPPPRWQTCSQLTNEYFGWTISEKFLTVFDGVMKEQLNQTSNYLKAAFNESLLTNNSSRFEWIATDETREFALKRIELMRTFLGFPEWWLLQEKQQRERQQRHQPVGGGEETLQEGDDDSVNSFVEEFYSDLNFTDATNYFQNYIEVVMWMSRKRLGDIITLSQNNDDSFETRRGRWPKFDYPTKMESYYSEYLNYLFLPMGVIDRSNPLMGFTFPSLHYGSLGVELARNMLKGVVGSGGKYNKPPKWWDNETTENYRNNVTDCFEKMVFAGPTTQQTPIDEQTTTILLTGALSLSHQAYKTQTSNDEQEQQLLPGLQDYTPDQLFFLSFAQSQCSHDQRNGEVVVKNVLSNSVEFAGSWGCEMPPPRGDEDEDVCRVV